MAYGQHPQRVTCCPLKHLLSWWRGGRKDIGTTGKVTGACQVQVGEEAAGGLSTTPSARLPTFMSQSPQGDSPSLTMPFGGIGVCPDPDL